MMAYIALGWVVTLAAAVLMLAIGLPWLLMAIVIVIIEVLAAFWLALWIRGMRP